MDANLTLVGNTVNPFGQKIGDGMNVAVVSGQSGEYLQAETRGKYAQAGMRGISFSANVTAKTVGVISATYVSVFALYNPPGSGVNLELIDMDVGSVVAATVVNTLGLYFSPPVSAAAATFTTDASNTILPAMLTVPTSGKGKFYSAATFSGTPSRCAIIATYTATTATVLSSVHYEFDGSLIIPQGVLITPAMSTAASTASSVDIALRWMETPA
jgi:hypothetical protein